MAVTDFAVSELGSLDRWNELYGGFTPASSRAGKRVLDQDLALTYLGLSANSLEPGQDAGYWHVHSRIEEVYVFLSGAGRMGLDERVIDVSAGSAVRVGQGVWRTWGCRHDSEGPLRWLCIRGGGYELPDLPDDGMINRDRLAPW